MGAVFNRIIIWIGICAKLFKSLLFRGTIPERDRGKLPSVVLRIYDAIKLFYFSLRVRHVFGLKTIPAGDEEVVVLTLVKDGETWMEEYLEHYFAKGFSHIVLLDTGSIDDSLKIAKSYDNVTILETKVPFRDHDILFRRYLVKWLGNDRWSLTVDIDELWDYPHSDKVSLASLLRYLRQSGADTMIGQMLDMFLPNVPSQKMPTLKAYDLYDISAVNRGVLNKEGVYGESGFSTPIAFSDEICFFTGGIRGQLFGNEGIWLTKMPLLFNHDGIKPAVHHHFSNNVAIADVTSVLFHYKFTHQFKDQIESAVESKNYYDDSIDYRSYDTVFRDDPELNFKLPTAKKYESVEALVDEGLLCVSNSYLKWVSDGKNHERI